MARVKELAYVVYETRDLAAWEGLAVGLLGMQIGSKTADGLSLRTDEKAHRWLFERGSGDDQVASGYAVDDDQDLDAIVAKLKASGFEATEGDSALAASRKVDRIVVTSDPMGNRVELVTGLADAATPFRSELVPGGYLTGACGAGHQFVLTKKIEREDYMNYYHGILGFRISDRIVQEIAPGLVADAMFLHCNPRHHTIALGELPHDKKIHHFMVQVNDRTDFGTAWDRCLSNGHPFLMTLGGHPNDQMFSFYLETPSGFALEVGWGGLTIDDEATWQFQTYDRLESWGHHPQDRELAWLQECTRVQA
ncbi:MAG: VOC family protein [Propionibacteriaceae bacterium]|nr:VOC family protein [Propionibacteriaceae bacterium]